MGREIPKKTTMWKKCDFKKVDYHFDMNVFPRVVWILPQLAAFVLQLKQKNVHGRKSTEWILYLTIYLVKCYLLYSTVDFFIFFIKSCGVFY